MAKIDYMITLQKNYVITNLVDVFDSPQPPNSHPGAIGHPDQSLSSP